MRTGMKTQSELLYSLQQARQEGSCNPNGGSPFTYSALPMRHWYALHCAIQAQVAQDGAAFRKPICATCAVWRRVERTSPRGSSMNLLPCLELRP